MDRIAIIGCGGSGKTTLARRLGTELNAPVTHLDVVYYGSEWKPRSQEEFSALQEELVAGQRWVIDGNYASTLPIRLARASTVIFLDLPAVTCLAGLAQRRWRHGGGQNDALGVYDRIHWGFIRYVWNYRSAMAPRVRSLIVEHAAHAEVHTVRSRRGAKRLLTRLTTQARNTTS